MHRAILLLTFAALAGQQPGWDQARRVDVALSSFSFAPETLRLRAGAPVILRLANRSGGGHNFSAPDFFAAADVHPGDRAKIREGAVEVPSRSAQEIALVPRAGHYRLRCTHTLHSTFGMRGEIIVE